MAAVSMRAGGGRGPDEADCGFAREPAMSSSDISVRRGLDG
jgi:hypothetical protein